MSDRLAIVIPAYDEAAAIGGVVSGFRAAAAALARPFEVVVADNRSTDGTRAVAEAAGARVVYAERRGYGSACLAALADLAEDPPRLVVFADGDGSNDPRDLAALVAPIDRGEADLVIGSRPRRMDPGSLTVPQHFGNALAVFLIGRLYGARFTDLGPFRAITWSALSSLGMSDPDFGWTVEMQLLAAKRGLRVVEVDVANHARRAGRSKISGTVRGVVLAGSKILGTIAKHRGS